MKRIANQVIYDERVDCDNIHFHNVIFDGCILAMSRNNAHTYFTSTQAHHCKFVGDGWADSIIAMNAQHLAQQPKPEHEAEVTMTKAERELIKPVSIAGFVEWLRAAGFR